MAALRLSLVAVSGGHFIAMLRLLLVVASVADHRL